MGIYDREYYQEKPPGFHFGGNRMMVTNLVIINVVIYVAQLFFRTDSAFNITETFSLHSNLLSEPWKCWELVTYGFLHSEGNIFHLLGNMFCLWFFGRDIEPIYGKRTFLGFYLTAIIFAGLVGKFGEEMVRVANIQLIGASGGVAAVILVYIFHFPRRTLLFWGVLPMPAWALGVVFLVIDFMGTFRETEVAHSAHLAGAAYGYLFYRTRLQLFGLLPGRSWLQQFKSRPNVRIHQPPDDDAELGAEVDRILEKIGRDGESSLTPKERSTLQRASRRYQQKHR